MTLEVLQRFMTAEESTASLNSQLVYINERLTAIFFLEHGIKSGIHLPTVLYKNLKKGMVLI